MKGVLWVAATGVVAAATAATVASAATLGGVTSPDLDTSAASPSPVFYLYDHFASVGTVPLNGTIVPLSPTGLPADLGTVNAPTWTADSGWVVNGDVAQASGVGAKVATFPFIAQNSYVVGNFDTFAFNASAGLVVTYDAAAATGVALVVRRSGASWTIAIGTVAGGTFTETAVAPLPLTGADKPTGAELEARIANGVVTGSYDGVDYVSRAAGAGTSAGIISLTPNVAAAIHYVEAAKTP